MSEKRCGGKMVMTDSCYGMTGGYRYDCTVCGSYVVTRNDRGDSIVCDAKVNDEVDRAE